MLAKKTAACAKLIYGCVCVRERERERERERCTHDRAVLKI